MKLIIDIPESYYISCKEWVDNKCATVPEIIIANGKPYNPVVDPCDMNMFEPEEAILGKGMLEE